MRSVINSLTEFHNLMPPIISYSFYFTDSDNALKNYWLNSFVCYRRCPRLKILQLISFLEKALLIGFAPGGRISKFLLGQLYRSNIIIHYFWPGCHRRSLYVPAQEFMTRKPSKHFICVVDGYRFIINYTRFAKSLLIMEKIAGNPIKSV